MSKRGVFVIILIAIAVLAVVLYFARPTGLVSLNIDENYALNESLSGTVSFNIDSGDQIAKGSIIELSLIKDGNVIKNAQRSVEQFIGSQAQFETIQQKENRCVNVTNDVVSEVCVDGAYGKQECHNETIPQTEENCSDVVIGTSDVYTTQGTYTNNISDFFDYKFIDSGNYVLRLTLNDYNATAEKDITVEGAVGNESDLNVSSNESLIFGAQVLNESNITFNAQALTPGNISGCGVINTPGTYTLNQSINWTNGDCFDINADGITLDGEGNSITSNSSDPYNGNVQGVYSLSRSNVIINNLNIVNTRNAVYLVNINSLKIINISTDGTDYGLWIQNATGLNVSGGSNPSTQFSLYNVYNSNFDNLVGCYGIYGDNNNFTNVDCENTQSQGGILVAGNRNILRNVKIANTYDIYSRDGLRIYNGWYNVLDNISISNTTGGVQLGNVGGADDGFNNSYNNLSNINLNQQDLVFLGEGDGIGGVDNIVTNVSNGNLVIYYGIYNNTFSNLNLTLIEFNSNPSSGNVFNNVYLYAPASWLPISFGNGGNTFNNLTLANEYGEIKFLDSVVIANSDMAEGLDSVIADDSAFTDSATYPFFNVSAEILLINISTNFSDPVIWRTEGDNVTICNETSIPSCYNLTSLNAGDVVFNVSSWSSYAIGERSGLNSGGSYEEVSGEDMFMRDPAHTVYSGNGYPDDISNKYAQFYTGLIPSGGPLLMGDYVYATAFFTRDTSTFGGGMVFQLNASDVSQQIANYTIKTGEDPDLVGLTDSPSGANGSIYVTALNNVMYQLNASNISQLITTYNDSYGSTALWNGYAYTYCPSSGTICQLNASNVAQLIHQSGESFSSGGNPMIYNGNLYVGGGGTVYKFDASDVSQPAETYDTLCGGSSTTTAIVDDSLYMVCDNGNIYQINVTDMSLIGVNTETGVSIYSTPAVGNGFLYVAGSGGNLYQLNATNISDEYAPYITFTSTDGLYYPSLAGGYVYDVSPGGEVYQLNASDISQKISEFDDFSGAFNSFAAIGNGCAYAVGGNASVYQLCPSVYPPNFCAQGIDCGNGNPPIVNPPINNPGGLGNGNPPTITLPSGLQCQSTGDCSQASAKLTPQQYADYESAYNNYVRDNCPSQASLCGNDHVCTNDASIVCSADSDCYSSNSGSQPEMCSTGTCSDGSECNIGDVCPIPEGVSGSTGATGQAGTTGSTTQPSGGTNVDYCAQFSKKIVKSQLDPVDPNNPNAKKINFGAWTGEESMAKIYTNGDLLVNELKQQAKCDDQGICDIWHNTKYFVYTEPSAQSGTKCTAKNSDGSPITYTYTKDFGVDQKITWAEMETQIGQCDYDLVGNSGWGGHEKETDCYKEGLRIGGLTPDSCSYYTKRTIIKVDHGDGTASGTVVFEITLGDQKKAIDFYGWATAENDYQCVSKNPTTTYNDYTGGGGYSTTTTCTDGDICPDGISYCVNGECPSLSDAGSQSAADVSIPTEEITQATALVISGNAVAETSRGIGLWNVFVGFIGSFRNSISGNVVSDVNTYACMDNPDVAYPGLQSCFDINGANACNAMPTCSWNSNGYCEYTQGISACYQLTSPEACELIPGCGWNYDDTTGNNNRCVDKPAIADTNTPCSNIYNQGDCGLNTQYQCTWDVNKEVCMNNGVDFKGSCSLIGDQNVCTDETNSHCSWAIADNTVAGGDNGNGGTLVNPTDNGAGDNNGVDNGATCIPITRDEATQPNDWAAAGEEAAKIACDNALAYGSAVPTPDYVQEYVCQNPNVDAQDGGASVIYEPCSQNIVPHENIIPSNSFFPGYKLEDITKEMISSKSKEICDGIESDIDNKYGNKDSNGKIVPIPITQCGPITKSGVYEIQNDLDSGGKTACISVIGKGDFRGDVVILGNGHKISGLVDYMSWGVDLNEVDNIIIEGGLHIEGNGQGTGIMNVLGNNICVRNNYLQSLDEGIRFSMAHNVYISNNEISKNQNGILGSNSYTNIINDNNIFSSEINGMNLSIDSGDVISANSIHDNLEIGINQYGAQNGLINEGDIYNNQFAGISIINSNYISIKEVNVYNNGNENLISNFLKYAWKKAKEDGKTIGGSWLDLIISLNHFSSQVIPSSIDSIKEIYNAYYSSWQKGGALSDPDYLAFKTEFNKHGNGIEISSGITYHVNFDRVNVHNNRKDGYNLGSAGEIKFSKIIGDNNGNCGINFLAGYSGATEKKNIDGVDTLIPVEGNDLSGNKVAPVCPANFVNNVGINSGGSADNGQATSQCTDNPGLTSCSQISSQDICIGTMGCSWNSNGYCESNIGITDASQISDVSVCANLGYTWDYSSGECTGTSDVATCSGLYSAEECGSTSGRCLWSSDKMVCTNYNNGAGFEGKCSNIFDVTKCNAIPVCSWNGNAEQGGNAAPADNGAGNGNNIIDRGSYKLVMGCAKLDEPNTLYQFGQGIGSIGSQQIGGKVACIQIGADGITLDGDGFSMSGSGTDIGISAIGVSGITIKNIGEISGFNDAIVLSGFKGAIQDTKIDGNTEYGILTEGYDNEITIDSSEISNNGQVTFVPGNNGALAKSASGAGISLQGVGTTTITSTSLHDNPRANIEVVSIDGSQTNKAILGVGTEIYGGTVGVMVENTGADVEASNVNIHDIDSISFDAVSGGKINVQDSSVSGAEYAYYADGDGSLINVANSPATGTTIADYLDVNGGKVNYA